jgi:[acyl-carrier-protein] S-malonyltransferase
MTNNIAVTFPGQGSQSVGMLAELAAVHPEVRKVFEEGSDALGRDLWALAQDGPKAELDDTRNTQPALLCAGIAVYRVLQAGWGGQPVVMAGHSLGEYTALVGAGALALTDAVVLVALRGRYMQDAAPPGSGAMAAILGLDDESVAALCTQAAAGQVLSPVNFNSPGQVVVAGHAEAVSRAVELAEAAGARRALMLDVSVPSHCALMRPAADRLAERLRETAIGMPQVPVLHNAKVAEARDVDEIRHLLTEQLFSPVRWVETVQAIAARDVGILVEAGPGRVLSGLARRIDRSLTALPVFDPATLDTAMEAINA